MTALELSSVGKVANYLGIDEQDGDYADLDEGLAVAREQITRMVLVDRLTAPYPVSLHRACTIKAAEIVGDRTARYGTSSVGDDGDGGVPLRILVLRLVENSGFARPQGGIGPMYHDPEYLYDG